MSGFETQEVSRTLGEPVDLYLFVYGPGEEDYYGYTDAEQAITLEDGKVYVPHPIMRDAVKSSGTLDKSALKVTVEAASEIAELFKIYPPSQGVTLFIRQGHIGDETAEFLVIWAGRVLSCKWDDSEAELTCDPIATAMRRAALRRHYQYGCPHALYQGDENGGCRASKAAGTRTATVAAISGATITLDSGWEGSFAKEKYRGGMVEWINGHGATESRTILRVNTDTLTVTGVIREVAVDATISVVVGCNHKPFAPEGDCQAIHDVIGDYGGQWLIPTKNPIGVYNNFV